MKVTFDFDYYAYSAASVCETRSVICKHLPSGKSKVFSNRTASKAFIKSLNEGRETPFAITDFVYEDVQTIDPQANYKRILDSLVENVLRKLRYNEFTDEYCGYVGRGKTFRHERAKILEYKGQRSAIKPLLLSKCKQYLVDKHNAEYVEIYEADDYCAIDQLQGYFAYKQSNDECDQNIIVSIDKDQKAISGYLFNPDKMEEPLWIDGFGLLTLDAKKKPDGHGRIWLWFQLLAGDSCDNYAANSASQIKYGPMSAYKALKDCKTDKEAIQVVVNEYKKLYPAPKMITGWRGDAFEIDWLYVVNENFDLCRMLRAVDDKITFTSVLERNKIECK